MMHLFPDLFAQHRVAPVETLSRALLRRWKAVAPPACEGDPVIALLTPGSTTRAYFEHSFLADQMGVELVEGQDLVVEDGRVYMRTTQGPRRIDVIYRRIDDDFLDPLTFRPDIDARRARLFDVYRAGGVTMVNAPGTGIADDKAIYTYIPEIIDFYLGEEPMLKNVPTYICRKSDDLPTCSSTSPSWW